MSSFDFLTQDEKVVLQLRGLYECYGYHKANVAEFEDYDLLMKNRSFLEHKNIITFMNSDGRLMALRPDVTLSIIKNLCDDESELSDKFYYVESVYRFFKESNEYRKIDQIGVEHVGGDENYANLEVISMALDTLHKIDENFILDISHMGFVSGMLDSMNLNDVLRTEIIHKVNNKNTHDLDKLLKETTLNINQREKLLALCNLSGKFEEVMEQASMLVINTEMKNALNQLNSIYNSMRFHGCMEHIDKINLDFSVINDLDYYNTFLFKGYVKNIPNVVLSGGRYNKLMQKLGKNKGGIGFAVSLDELAIHYNSNKSYDYDMVILYNNKKDINKLYNFVRGYVTSGRKVRVECIDHSSKLPYTYKEIYHYVDGNLRRENTI